MHNPAYFAWKCSGSPECLTLYQKYVFQGECSHCGIVDNVVPVKRVVSARFTNWDQYSNHDKPAWCNPCVWSFTEKNNRDEAMLLNNNILYSGYQLQSMKNLLKSPIDEKSFVSVALRKNRHVLPYAKWGRVSIEDIDFQWRNREIELLEAVEELCGLGFSIGDIKKDESPSALTVIKLQPEDSLKAYSLWNEIKVLRNLPHIFTLILELNKAATMEYKTSRLT